MLISHEVPTIMLKESALFNDYDYCLLHLVFENESYKNYYINSSLNGRKVLLDNSLFELGDALSQDVLIQGIELIKPVWYVVPDCLNNKQETIDRFEKFVNSGVNLPGLKIGVVQGRTIEEMIDCYKYMSEKADKIAIPFDSQAFENTESSDKLSMWCEGRVNFIKLLNEKGVWNHSKPHHLLGCSLAKEFKEPLYRNLNIETVDTSNPIVAGCLGIPYHESGLDIKPSIKLCELIDFTPNDEQRKIIRRNVEIFRGLAGG